MENHQGSQASYLKLSQDILEKKKHFKFFDHQNKMAPVDFDFRHGNLFCVRVT